MPYFKWRAINLYGFLVSGSSTVLHKDALLRQLYKQQLGLVSVKQIPWTRWYRPVRRAQLLDFFIHIRELMDAGLSIDISVQLTSRSITHAEFRLYLEEIYMHIQEGSSFAQALSSYPELFDELTCACLQIGEQAGHLSKSFSLLISYLTIREEFSKKMRSALFSPLVTLGVFAIVILFLLKIVIPGLAKSFESMGQVLPYATVFLLELSGYITLTSGLLVGLGIIFLIRFVKYICRHKKIKLSLERIICSLPGCRSMISLQRFTYTSNLALLVKSGMPLPQALRQAAEYMPLIFLRSKLYAIAQDVSAGVAFDRAVLQEPRIFNVQLHALCALGQESGNMGAALERAAHIQYQHINKQFMFVVQLIQPCLIIMLGLLLASVISIVYYPLLTSLLIIGD